MAINLDMIPDLSGQVLFIAIGQGGSNIGIEFQKLGYTVYYINTSARDLKPIDAPENFKHHIAGATGCKKNRKKAKEYAMNSYQKIAKDIKSRFSGFTNIVFCTSAGGGTGSGITPMLIKAFSVISPDICISSIVAVPSLKESPKIRANAVMFYNDMTKLDNLCTQFWIDNEQFVNELEMLEHNALCAEKIHGILNMASVDTRGNIDEEEVRGLLDVKGSVVIANVKEKGNDLKTIDIDENFIYGKGRASHSAYSITKDLDNIKGRIEEVFGQQDDSFVAFKSGGKSFVVLFGLPMPSERFNVLKNSYDEHIIDVSEIEEVKNEVIEIKVEEDLSEKRIKKASIESALDDIFDDLL